MSNVKPMYKQLVLYNYRIYNETSNSFISVFVDFHKLQLRCFKFLIIKNCQTICRIVYNTNCKQYKMKIYDDRCSS